MANNYTVSKIMVKHNPWTKLISCVDLQQYEIHVENSYSTTFLIKRIWLTKKDAVKIAKRFKIEIQ